MKRDIQSYRRKLRGLSNPELVDEAGSQILGAAVMEGFSRFNDGWADECAMACLDEADRRGNRDLYQRGFNSAVLDAHGDTIRILHRLQPIGVAMAGPDIYDPFKD